MAIVLGPQSRQQHPEKSDPCAIASRPGDRVPGSWRSSEATQRSDWDLGVGGVAGRPRRRRPGPLPPRTRARQPRRERLHRRSLGNAPPTPQTLACHQNVSSAPGLGRVRSERIAPRTDSPTVQARQVGSTGMWANPSDTKTENQGFGFHRGVPFLSPRQDLLCVVMKTIPTDAALMCAT